MVTPLQKEIIDGTSLRQTKRKKMATPLRKAIQTKPKLQKTKRTMNLLLQKEIRRCPKLRKTKQTMPLEVQIEIIKGKQLRPTKKSLPTPLKKEIRSAVTLRQTKRYLPTPLQDEIKRGVQLQKAKSLRTPLRRQLEEGVSLKQTGRSLKRKRSESGTNDNEPKRLKPPPSIAVNETDEELDIAPVRRTLKTPLRKAIAAGTRLCTTRHHMTTPLRKQIHSKHILRAVRRKSTVITVPEKTLTRKPTYAEVVKRPKKTLAEAKRVSRESSCKFRNMAKGSSKVIPSVKISEMAVENPEIARVQVNGVQLKNRRNSTSLARKSTPQTKSAKLTDNQGMPSLLDTGEKAKKNCWMSSLAKATNGVKTRGQSVENLEGLSKMFTTPPAVQMTSNNFPGEKHAGNWLSDLAKATIVPRKHGMPVEDLQGVPEMSAAQPLPNAGSDCNRTSKKSLSSTDEEAMVEIRNVVPLDTLHVEAVEVSPDKSEIHMTESLAPTKTPSLKSSGKDTTHIEIVSPIKSSYTPSLRSGRNQTSKSAVTQRAMIETGEVLKPNRMPSLSNSAEDTLTVQVVTSVQLSRTPSLHSARSLLCIQNSECSDLELEIVQPIAPNRTPSMHSSAETKAVLRNSIGNPTEDQKCPGLRLTKSPRESNSAESVENFFIPNMFASPKPQPKRYSRKSEGLQGVARLLRTPDAEGESTVESPKLDGIKSMMQPEKSLASPYFFGLKTLMKTPKICQSYVDPEEYFSAELFASPVQDTHQGPAQLAARGRKDKKHSVRIIRPTSSKTKATTAERSRNIVSETSLRATRSKRKAPEHSIEPVPKRVRCTRATAKQQIEGKPETRSSSKAVQNNTTVKNQKERPEVIQDTPKPFVFKRTKLDPIIEVQSPLPSFDDATEITTSSSLIEETEKASNEEKKTGNAPETRKQLNAPLRSSRRRNRCKTPAETPVEEYTTKKVAETYLEARRKKNESVVEHSTNTGDSLKAPVKMLEPKGERKSQRATRNTKANENSLNTMAPPIKTRMTRNQRAENANLAQEVGDCCLIKEAVKNPAPRRARSLAKTTKEHAQVLGKTKPTRSTGHDETLDEVADPVPANRSTRASWKQANNTKVVENDNLAQSTRGKNSGKDEVKELKKEVTTKKMKQPPGARSIIQTRGNSTHKAEGDNASLEVKKEERPDNSSKKHRARRNLKGSTTNESKETISTRSRKAVEDQVEFTKHSMHSKVRTKRSRQENARTPPPEPKTTRASILAQSGLNMRITRSHSQK